ncbi:uncharacterized protein B0T15DRAFT_541030 [Chaetomium strumarium]|uniref:Uncharacterized protein n=1 Tax=Chaetomium strumarium TaxID=1170767 RepID=A0AAJ0GPC9_9PEZI|nr:hypothetical protein B0T15DRAFT_541030 [Chaetomium strumarium]
MSIQACKNCPNLEVYTPNLNGHENRWQSQSVRCDELQTSTETKHPLTIIFAQADAVRECESCKKTFEDRFGIYKFWWTNWARRSNGYYGCEEHGDEENQLKTYNTWFRFLVKMTEPAPGSRKIAYHWLKWNVFTHWVSKTKQTFLIAFDPKDFVKKVILSITLPAPLDLSQEPPTVRCIYEDPYWVHVPILEQVADSQDVAVWKIRDLVRTREKSRPDVAAPNPDYERDHDIARHAIHVSETVELSTKTLDHILYMHKDFARRHLPEPKPGEVSSYHQIDKQLWFLEHTMHSLKARSVSNKDRLLNEIQLAFNIVSQYDSQTSVLIGRATQYDSYSMRTVAFLTLAFLPATFISAVFSMSFFDIDDDMNWRVSAKIWMYFAIAGPVTIVAVSVWLFWQKLIPAERVAYAEISDRGRVDSGRGSIRGPWNGSKFAHAPYSFQV